LVLSIISLVEFFVVSLRYSLLSGVAPVT
jgi:hypothetical protein